MCVCARVYVGESVYVCMHTAYVLHPSFLVYMYSSTSVIVYLMYILCHAAYSMCMHNHCVLSAHGVCVCVFLLLKPSIQQLFEITDSCFPFTLNFFFLPHLYFCFLLSFPPGPSPSTMHFSCGTILHKLSVPTSVNLCVSA